AAASAIPHYSSLPGLIHATRRAAAIVGVDRGPLHLAAALAKPGVAIFGPTDRRATAPTANRSASCARAPPLPRTSAAPPPTPACGTSLPTKFSKCSATSSARAAVPREAGPNDPIPQTLC